MTIMASEVAGTTISMSILGVSDFIFTAWLVDKQKLEK